MLRTKHEDPRLRIGFVGNDLGRELRKREMLCGQIVHARLHAGLRRVDRLVERRSETDDEKRRRRTGDQRNQCDRQDDVAARNAPRKIAER
jgi:hypothetical protein